MARPTQLRRLLRLLLAVRRPLPGWRLGWVGLMGPLFYVSWWGGMPWDPVQLLLVVLVLAGAAGIRQDRSAVLGSLAFLALGFEVDSVASRQRAQAALADQADAAEVERARRAVFEERARIARELHDVVAHHMSLMAIAPKAHRLGALPDPEQVRTEFCALSQSAREALTDMRLARRVRLPDHPGSPGWHSAGAAVTVSVHQDADTVRLHVANGPQALPGRPQMVTGQDTAWPGCGNGPNCSAARSRPARHPTAGFVVSAVLPLSGSSA